MSAAASTAPTTRRTTSPNGSAWRAVPLVDRALVHERAGRRARHVIALTGASDWRRRAADRLGALVPALVGTSVLPDASAPTWPPLDRLPNDGGHDAWADALRTALPGTHTIGVILPRQAGRQRLSVLGRSTGNLVVVKFAGDPAEVDREAAALELLARRPLPGIATPKVIEAGRLDVGLGPLGYLVTNVISITGQRPAVDAPLRTFEADLAERLSSLPGRPDDGAVPVHGDLTPWNLRRTGRGLALFDWESVGWGRPGDDLATYRAACDEIRPWWRRSAR